MTTTGPAPDDPDTIAGDEVPWITCAAPGQPGDVQGVIAAYRHSQAVAAMLRSRLPGPGHTVVPGVDGDGRPMVSIDGVRVVLTAPIQVRRGPGAA